MSAYSAFCSPLSTPLSRTLPATYSGRSSPMSGPFRICVAGVAAAGDRPVAMTPGRDAVAADLVPLHHPGVPRGLRSLGPLPLPPRVVLSPPLFRPLLRSHSHLRLAALLSFYSDLLELVYLSVSLFLSLLSLFLFPFLFLFSLSIFCVRGGRRTGLSSPYPHLLDLLSSLLFFPDRLGLPLPLLSVFLLLFSLPIHPVLVLLTAALASLRTDLPRLSRRRLLHLVLVLFSLPFRLAAHLPLPLVLFFLRLVAPAPYRACTYPGRCPVSSIRPWCEVSLVSTSTTLI